MITYYLIVSSILTFLILFILSNFGLIFKNCKTGNFFRSSLLKYIIKRILGALLALFVIITLIFILIRIMPKDYFYTYVDEINYFKQKQIYTSNDSLLNQLFDFYYSILPFPKKICSATYLNNGNIECGSYSYKIIDLGYSYVYMRNTSVWTIIKEKCGISLLIGMLAYCLQWLVGCPLGIYLAKNKNKFFIKLENFLHISITSIPAVLYFYSFVLAFMLWFKLPISFEISDPLSYIAPLIALCFWGCFHIAYWVHRYISLELDKDYVKFALAKGITYNRIFYKHVTRNALIPLIRTIPTSIALSLSGFYLLEASFNIPGIGLTLISAINLQDVYLAQGLILFFSSICVLAYLAGDIITTLLDNRVKLSKEGK